MTKQETVVEPEVKPKKEENSDSLIVNFLNGFEGQDGYKTFLISYMLDSVGEYSETDDFNFYDYHFHQVLIDAHIEYSKSVLDDVRKGSKKKELKEIVDALKDEEVVTWKDIYDVIIELNRDKRFAKFIGEKQNA